MEKFSIKPLTVETWKDFEILFGENGACDGCWCMFWRVKRSEFDKGKGEGNRMRMRDKVRAGEVLGLILYVDDAPAGWCSIAKRSGFAGLADSRILAPVDGKDVWSASCFFVGRAYRGRGITEKLLAGAVEHVKRNGGGVIEGYPVDTEKKIPAAAGWHGLAHTFLKAGFKEVARRSEKRPIVRKAVKRG
jgi:GNAT superfamily N-acetyltransferase